MSSYYRHLIQYGSYAYLIDLFPSITMAFDFRKLRSAYSGNAIKVLRASDNTEQDFPFVANEVVGSDVLDFVGWNLFSYSEDLSQSFWTKGGVTVTTDSIVAPDGLTTGDVLFETIGFGQHQLLKSVSVVSGQTYTISFWIKDEGRHHVRISTSSDFSQDGTTPIAWLDLSLGTIVSENSGFTGSDLTLTADGSWYKVSYTMPCLSTASLNVLTINTSTDGSTISYAGDVTKGIAVWGLQRTESLIVLDYRKTLATAEGVGSISKGYDQATGGDDVINATIIRQPIIVNNGNLITDGGKLALQGGSTLGLRSTNTVALSGYTDLFMTFGVNVTDTTTLQNILESSSNFNSNDGAINFWIQSGVLNVMQRRTSSTPSTRMYKTFPISTGRQLITIRFRTAQACADASQVWINGVEITGTVVTNNPSVTMSNQIIYLFSRNANSVGFLGKYQNFTMFTDLAQRPGIENNINDYYGYY